MTAELPADDWPQAATAAAVPLVDERIAAAVLREADAAGAVHLATAQLGELREQAGTSASKIVAAEQKLASAERHHQAAKDGVIRAQRRVAEEADQADRAAAAAEAEATPALAFPTLPAFVVHLVEMYRREVFDSSERTWCPRWWDHPEAIARLEAMWRAFEALRHEPGTGLSVWWINHVDPHMTQLMQPHGPFRGCTAKRGHSESPLSPFRLEEPPEDWWPEDHSGL